MRLTARFLIGLSCVSLLCLWAGQGFAQEAGAQPSQTLPNGYHWPIHYDGPMVHHGNAAALPGLPHFHVTFHGGPVQTQTTSYAIYWKPPGSTMRSGYQTVINQFLKDVGGSPLYGVCDGIHRIERPGEKRIEIWRIMGGYDTVSQGRGDRSRDH